MSNEEEEVAGADKEKRDYNSDALTAAMSCQGKRYQGFALPAGLVSRANLLREFRERRIGRSEAEGSEDEELRM